MIGPRETNNDVENCHFKMIKLFGLDWKSQIKINNYLYFCKLMSKKPCTNGFKNDQK